MKSIASLLVSCLVVIMLAIPARAEEAIISSAIDRNGGNYYFNPHRIIVAMILQDEMLLCKEAPAVPAVPVAKAPEDGTQLNSSRGYRQLVVILDPATGSPCLLDCSIADHRKQGLKGLLEAVD